MALAWEQVTIAAKDPVALGQWWREVMDWVVVDEGPVVFEIQPESGTPGMFFLPVDEPKVGHNRLHVDLRPDDQAAEVARLLALGATKVDVGQGDVSWVVMADPEGNEFCVLSGPLPPA